MQKELNIYQMILVQEISLELKFPRLLIGSRFSRTIGGGDNAVSQFLDNAVQGELGKNYLTQCFTPT